MTYKKAMYLLYAGNLIRRKAWSDAGWYLKSCISEKHGYMVNMLRDGCTSINKYVAWRPSAEDEAATDWEYLKG